MNGRPTSPMTMRASKVVDSRAMLAWLLGQAAAPKFGALLGEAELGNIQLTMSWMNVAEVYYISAKRHGLLRAEEFLLRLPSLPIRVVLPDGAEIMKAARVKAARRVAFGDAFAIALAQNEGAAVITGDPEIRDCGLVPVDWLGASGA